MASDRESVEGGDILPEITQDMESTKLIPAARRNASTPASVRRTAARLRRDMAPPLLPAAFELKKVVGTWTGAEE